MLRMVPEPLVAMDCGTNVAAQTSVGILPNKKNQGKVPKKIHKAEREKLKRDQLNELFLELGNILEPARQNNGKASMLSDATRILSDLFVQVKSLRKENVALVTESQYVTVEKNELKDETTALEAEIVRLHNELQERIQSNTPTSTSLPIAVAPSPVTPPLYVSPFHDQELQTLSKPSSTQVKRPRARYPTPLDSWPMQILLRDRCSSNDSSFNSGDEGSDKAKEC